jgi:two-component system OmpR family response regulator
VRGRDIKKSYIACLVYTDKKVRSFDLKILVIEDNVDISEALSFFCGARKDIECEVINTGEEGLDRIRKENFDLILLDLAMPDFSGMDVLLSLKLDGLIKSRNIAIFTASSNQEVLTEIRNIGVKEIFQKPFSLDDLIKLIERYRPGA